MEQIFISVVFISQSEKKARVYIYVSYIDKMLLILFCFHLKWNQKIGTESNKISKIWLAKNYSGVIGKIE